jgi:hypothetical protein
LVLGTAAETLRSAHGAVGASSCSQVRASGRYKATKRVRVALDTEVEEQLRYTVFLAVGQKESGVELLAISGVNCRLYIPVSSLAAATLTIFGKYSCSLISSIKLYRYYSDDDECRLAKEMSGW